MRIRRRVTVFFIAALATLPALRAESAPERESRRGLSRRSRRPLPRELHSLFRAVPKTELHLHLAGSTPLEQLRRFRREEGMSAERAAQLKVKKNYASLNDFLETYYKVAVIKTKDQLERATAALVERAAEENVRYLEVRSSINYKDHLPAREAAEAIERGMRAGVEQVEKRHGFRMGVGLIVLAQRAGPPEKSLEAAKLAVELSKRPDSLVRGFDLAGSESDHAVDKHAKALRYFAKYGKRRGLGLTIHAGETERSEDLSGLDSVRHALAFGADRIGHGLQLAKDPELMAEVARAGVHVELNPWSNVQLGNVEDFEAHPLKLFMEAGLSLSLSTDNRTISDIDLTEQLEMLYRHGQIRSWSEIKKLTLDGIDAGFAPRDERARVHEEVEQVFREIEQDSAHREAIERYLSP